jgi:hypothetical protein
MEPLGNTIELELDSRQRLPLARVIQGSQHRFRVTTMPDGSLILTPMVSISERELAMLCNPEALASLREGIDQAARGEVVRYKPGYFTRLAEELDDEGKDESGNQAATG